MSSLTDSDDGSIDFNNIESPIFVNQIEIDKPKRYLLFNPKDEIPQDEITYYIEPETTINCKPIKKTYKPPSPRTSSRSNSTQKRPITILVKSRNTSSRSVTLNIKSNTSSSDILDHKYPITYYTPQKRKQLNAIFFDILDLHKTNNVIDPYKLIDEGKITKIIEQLFSHIEFIKECYPYHNLLPRHKDDKSHNNSPWFSLVYIILGYYYDFKVIGYWEDKSKKELINSIYQLEKRTSPLTKDDIKLLAMPEEIHYRKQLLAKKLIKILNLNKDGSITRYEIDQNPRKIAAIEGLSDELKELYTHRDDINFLHYISKKPKSLWLSIMTKILNDFYITESKQIRLPISKIRTREYRIKKKR